MKLNELLNFLEKTGIDKDKVNIQMEPSHSTSVLQNLEQKYSICTQNVVNHEMTQQFSKELIGLTNIDYQLWLDSYENFLYFKGDKNKINRVPLEDSNIESYFVEMDKEQIKKEYQSEIKEDEFSSSFIYSFFYK